MFIEHKFAYEPYFITFIAGSPSSLKQCSKFLEFSRNDSRVKRLKEIFLAKAFLKRRENEEPFRLVSGELTYVYFDSRMVTQDPEGIALIAEIILDEISKLQKVDAIGGAETGAIPISTAVSCQSFLRNKPISSFWVRRERKTYGTKKWVEGNLQPGYNIVVVEDVTTTGGSVIQVIERTQSEGCNVVAVISLVDRERGAKARFREAGYEFGSIFVMSDFPFNQ